MLLGPNGQPLSYAQPRRKIKPPLIGELTNPWNAQPAPPSRFPFDNMLQFDTSRLRLDDYRMMRDHYQVNSSITVLSFMLHQMEWTIECDNIKQGRHCEDNLRRIWTRLVRGLSSAFVFGYSGMALQWENEAGRTVITKVKDLRPETIEPRWKEIEGVVPRTNPKTMPRKTKIFDGIRQPGYPDVPVDNSLWYPLLMENGNYYGRKLLNAAYQPWFFSNLIHMFANRYYERFGSPTMVGRAPFEEKIDMGNGIEVQGNVLMASAMRVIRNGADVTLPNTQAQNGLDGTGNYDYTLEYLESQMRGADFERYLTRLDQEISLALFTPLLMMNTADGGSFNLGVVHTQMYLSMLNAIAADWKEYIDRYVLAPMGRHNFGYQAKPAQIKFRRLGAMDQETARTILNNLMTGGNGDKAVKFDVDELGRYLGLGITEVEKLTEPSPIMEPGAGEEDPKPDPAAGGKPVAPRRDTRVGRPEREQRGKGLNKRKSVALAMAERVAAQFAKAIHDGVAPDGFVPDLGFRKQLAEAAPEVDYAEFAAESEDWIRAYYEIEAAADAPLRSEICERLRGGLEAALTRGVGDEAPHAA